MDARVIATPHHAGGNQAKAARWLGITRLKMREKLAELRLKLEQK